MSNLSGRELSLTEQSTWLFCAKILGFGFSILLPLLIVRYLTPAEVGIYRQSFLLITNAVVILPLGFSMSAFYFFNRTSGDRRSAVINILLFNFAMGAGAFLTLLFFPGLLESLFHSTELTALAPLVGLVIWLWVVAGFLEIAPLANREIRLATLFIVLTQLSRVGLMAGAVVIFHTLESFIYAAILQGSLQVVMLLVYLSRRFSLFWRRFDWDYFRKQVRYAMPFGLIAVLFTGQTDLHNYFVSYRFGPAAFAIYSQGCFQLPLIGILYESISSVVIPRMSRLQETGQKREMLIMTANAMQKLAFAYFPLFTFLMIVADEFIVTLFTREYASSIPIFRINLLLLPSFCLIVDPIARAFPGMSRFLLKVRVVLFAAMMLALWYGTRNFDLRGMISVVVVTVLVEKTASVWKTCRVLEAKRQDIHLLIRTGYTAFAAILAGLGLLVFYLMARDILISACFSGWHFAVSGTAFEKGADFLGGCTFLAICFLLYASIYLPFAGKLGAIEDSDKERMFEFIRGALRWFRARKWPYFAAN